jgi:hypothetical protein
MVSEKIICPQEVEHILVEFIDDIEKAEFFDGPEIPEGYTDVCKTHLWNIAGKSLIDKFIAGDMLLFDDTELTDILNKTIIYTCIDSLMDEGLVDSIENEHGENMFWITDKGKDIIS